MQHEPVTAEPARVQVPARHVRVGPYVCFLTRDPVLIRQARVLLAEVYVARGFAMEKDVVDGVLTPAADPHAETAQYFVFLDPSRTQVLATLRTLHWDDRWGQQSFPMLMHSAVLDPSPLAEITGRGLDRVIEVSALARAAGVSKIRGIAALGLYKAMFFAERQPGEPQPTFIMACNPKIWCTFQMLFRGAARRMGPDLPYAGQDATPAMIYVPDVVEQVITGSRAGDLTPPSGSSKRWCGTSSAVWIRTFSTTTKSTSCGDVATVIC